LLNPQKSQRKKAFSLIEISVVLLLIGAIVAGITVSAKYLIKKARVSTARSLTISSVINGIPDNVLWLETSIIETSLSNTTETDGSKLGSGDAITAWSNHSNQNQDPITISAVGDGATLSNSINYIPAVQFSGSDSNYLRIADADFLNNTDYTIFITEQREASGEAYFVGADGGTDNQTLLLGYSTDSAPIHSQGSGNEYTGSIEGFSTYGNKPRTFTFVSDSVDGKKMYINGTLVAQDSDTTQITGLTTLDIGKGYTGEIAEIVIFDRALKTEERNSVVDYMTTKWKAPNTRLTTANCTSGVITSTGCSQVCSAPTINGTTTSTTADGEEAEFTCNGTGYDGSTLNYTCSSGSLSPTPTAGDCADAGCDSGYFADGDECVQGCSVATIIGTSDSGGSVADGASVTCDETGYDGSTLGTCSSGNEITGSCDCDTNYSDPDSNGSCTPQCILSSGDSGLPSNVYVDDGDTSYDCSNVEGYEDTITFDACSGGNTVTNVSASCSEVINAACTGGDTTDVDTVPGDVIHTFTTIGDTAFSCSEAVTGAQILVVAGGGGAGGNRNNYTGGGGGGGGLIETTINLDASGTQTYTVTVGGGGAGGAGIRNTGSGDNGVNGENSLLVGSVSGTIHEAIGGGGGGGGLNGASSGLTGGSGGGEGGNIVSGTGTPTAGTSGQGNAGGVSYNNRGNTAGGGGGAGSAGGNGAYPPDQSGDGGDGLESTITGGSVFYAGGGRGGYVGNSSNRGLNGSGSYGRGGAGGTSDGGNGGNGAAGIVIIRYTNP